MAGHVRYTALLDACVLFPVLTCDALMSVAATGIYAAKWSARIDAEWMRNLEAHRGMPAGSFHRRCDAMHRACPDWEVPDTAWQPVEAGLLLPDPNDRHVLAAAIAGHADCIVTGNLKDFPANIVEPLDIEVIHPDDFLRMQIELNPLLVLPAFRAMRARLRNPSVTPGAFASNFAHHGLVSTAEYLRRAQDLL